MTAKKAAVISLGISLFFVAAVSLGGCKKTCADCKAWCKDHPDKATIRATGSISMGEMQCEMDYCGPGDVTDGPCK